MASTKTKTEREIDEIIIHTSDSTYGNAALIDHWHRERGWDKIGYHKVILNGKIDNSTDYDISVDGLIETGRADNEIGAGVYGHNDKALHVCLIGTPFNHTPAEIRQLVACIRYYKEKYDTIRMVSLHSEHNKGTKYHKPNCPGINAVDLLEIFAGG